MTTQSLSQGSLSSFVVLAVVSVQGPIGIRRTRRTSTVLIGLQEVGFMTSTPSACMLFAKTNKSVV